MLSVSLVTAETPASKLSGFMRPREDIKNIIMLIPDGMSMDSRPAVGKGLGHVRRWRYGL